MSNLKKIISVCSIFILFFALGCKKEKDKDAGKAVITNTTVMGATHTQATVTYNITADGGNAITEHGVCYSTTANPTTSSSLLKSDTLKLGVSTIKLKDLTSNTTYYARPYAINSAGTAYGPEVTLMTTKINLGDSFKGGIVFYLDGSGEHGLTSTPAGLNMSGTWGCMGTAITGTSVSLGSGAANTLAIAAACTTAGIAARGCKFLIYNGFTDWYLPSREEAAEMYKQRALIGLNSANRWTSSESDANQAWAQSFDPAVGTSLLVDKNSSLGYRAIRTF